MGKQVLSRSSSVVLGELAKNNQDQQRQHISDRRDMAQYDNQLL